MIRKWRAGITLADLASSLKIGEARSSLESAVARRAGTEYGLAFSYAHAGFFALIKALGLTKSEIILPAYTCDVMADVVIATGNIPVFVDISLADYNMDLDKLEAAITNRTRMIVATHMFGYIMPLDKVREMCAGKPITLVEDAVLTYPGATRVPGGLQGDAVMYSFGPGKPMFAIRGGVLVLSDPELYARVAEYRDTYMNGLSRRDWYKRWGLTGIHYLLSIDPVHTLASKLNLSKHSFTSGSDSTLGPGGQPIDPLDVLPDDFAVRFPDFQARIGLQQVERIDYMLARRRRQAQRYFDAMQGIGCISPAPLLEGACYGMYSVLIPNRDEIQFRKRMKQLGVEVSRNFPYHLPGLSGYRDYSTGVYPNAEKVGREVVNLPMNYDMTEQQTSQTVQRMLQALQR